MIVLLRVNNRTLRAGNTTRIVDALPGAPARAWAGEKKTPHRPLRGLLSGISLRAVSWCVSAHARNKTTARLRNTCP
eukprot:6320485-Lingulodinium_polyedra.AAC.1